MEPKFTTAAQLLAVLKELKRREPIFHQPEFGTTRADYESMTDANFWEVGASGRRYSREYMLDTLENRPPNRTKFVGDRRVSNAWRSPPDNYLMTYTLFQGPRVTRRATLWRKTQAGWKILYHQGTMVEES